MNNERLEQLQRIAALNREIYKDYPAKTWSKKGQEPGIYLQYRFIFKDNQWKEMLWKVSTFIPDKGLKRRRRFYAANKVGRVLNLHTWAMMYNRNYSSLKHYFLFEGLSLEEAIEKAMLGYSPEAFPFHKINFTTVEAAEDGRGVL